jgi:anti-sigma-K factor RskA
VIEDGTPLPAGLFEGGERTAVALTRPVRGGAVVAVTLEPAGGVAAPTGDPLVTVEAT